MSVWPLAVFSLLVPAFALAQSPPGAAKEPVAVASLPSLAPLVDSVRASVVNVDVQARRAASAEEGSEDEQMERFFGRRGNPKNQLKQGAGSGFIVDPRGLVLTNNHVVEGAVIIRVRLEDGRAFDADVLGRDPLTDLALLRLRGKPENLPVARLGDSSTMRVGDFAVAIGNPFGLASSVSLGIVSALDRNIHAGPYDQFLQTDAAINPGNSGGPLFNLKGEVIGINTAIVGGGTGIGFAVPSNVAKALMPQLEKDGAVTRGWLGVGIQDLSPSLAKAMGIPQLEGAVITAVNDGSPAKRGGVVEDDVIVSIDGTKVLSGGGLSRTVALKRPDTEVKLAVYRGGKPLELKVKLGTRPDLENFAARAAPAEPPGAKQPRVGLSFQDMDPRLSETAGLPVNGALVVEVTPGSPAERAGLRRGMVIVEAGKKQIRGRDDLMKILSEGKSGTVVLLRVMLPGSGGRVLQALELP
ncbi:MAG: HtrA protease/chaperone protein [Myxococcaceae bacterium]|nr:HtrA protease/chaperone protein [Myxococcaceae bacterium]